MAAMVALTESAPYAGCEVPPTDWSAQGLLPWDGDWLLIHPGWNGFEAELPAVFEAASPWPSLAGAPDVAAVELAVTAEGRETLRAEAPSHTAEWLAWRDPTGNMQRDLDAVDAFADGYVDIGEGAEVMANRLNAEGIDASIVELDEPSTTHEDLAEPDVDVMVEHAFALAGS